MEPSHLGAQHRVNAQVNPSAPQVRAQRVGPQRAAHRGSATSAPMAQSTPTAAPARLAPSPSSIAADAAPNDRALRARIESKLRLSMESFDVPLSPSLPSSHGDDADVSRTDPMLGVEATPSVTQSAAVFFTEQEFSRISQQSELFRQRWSEHQTHLHSIFAHTLQEREQREQREKAKAAAASVSPTLSRTVTFTTPETVPPSSASPHNPQPAPSALARSPSGAVPLSFASTAAAASPSASAALPRSDMEMAAAAAGVAVSRPSRLSSLSAEEHSVFLQYQMQARSRAAYKHTHIP